MSQSIVLEAAYVVPTEMAATPVIAPNGGFFYYQTNVTISCATEGAAIYYTTDGSEPSKLSTKYEAPFTLNRIGATKVKAAAFKSGMFYSMTAVSAVFNIAYPAPPKPATPVIGEATGIDAGKLTLSCSTSGAKIYYTLDGSTPTAASSLYDANAKILIAFDTPGLGGALKAIAIAGGVQSDAASIVIAKDNASLNAAIEDTSNAPFVVAGGTNYNNSNHTIDKTFIFKETLSGIKPNKIVTISAREGTSAGRIDAFDIAFHNANPASIKAPKLYAPQRPLYGMPGASDYAISTINIVSGDFSSYVNADEYDNKLVINRPNFTMTGVSATGDNKTLFKKWFRIYDQNNITLKNFAIALDNADKLVVDIINLSNSTIEGLHLSNSSSGTSEGTMYISNSSGLTIKNNTIEAKTNTRPAIYFIKSGTITFTGNTVKGSVRVEHKYSGAELSSIVSLFSSNTANTFSDPYLTISGATNKYLFDIIDSGSVNYYGGNFEYGSAQITNLIGTGNTFNNLNQGGAKFDMLAWPENNYNYGYYYGDTVPERLFIKTSLAKKAGDDGNINVTFAAKGSAPAVLQKYRRIFLNRRSRLLTHGLINLMPLSITRRRLLK
ncbi:MAG TPA: chitobiase/beta-hexosaminidase C-terminal domain-containing protein [Candidatus Wallbacteria bacterium]|nr:chitobiase/beta-hexosaminidase C-terminal domain-containing protein [Candidatus Wallbacteria bacterium]